jgi:hypothetical protein
MLLVLHVGRAVQASPEQLLNLGLTSASPGLKLPLLTLKTLSGVYNPSPLLELIPGKYVC